MLSCATRPEFRRPAGKETHISPRATTRPGFRIAVDIGGTFTDLVAVGTGRVVAAAKVLTTPADPSEAVERGVGEILDGIDPAGVGEVVHGTTLVSNSLIERKGARTALLTTKGFRDVLTIRRELRYDLYDLFLEMPEPLVPRRLRWEVDERILADGSVDRPVDPEDVRRIARRLEREGVQAAAISLLHSYRDPCHEQTVAAALREVLPDLPVSLSSEVAPELGEFHRTSTVVANAYVMPLVARYLERLRERLAAMGLRSPLHIMLSTGGGGLAGVDTAKRFPVRLLESGPAAGALSAGFWGIRTGHRDVLGFDMGGTTAKAVLIEDGLPLVTREHEAARVYRFTKGSGLPLKVPVIDLIEIGAGGGSIARVGPFGLPKVGPESASSDPGPVCYGLGGKEPTVTDADLVLGFLNPAFFLGGDMALDLDAARDSLSRLGDELGLPVEGTAAAVHRVVNENMASAARMHAIERGRDIRRFAIVATGGAGPVHAWGVARGIGIRTLVFPPSAGVASAFGMLTANPGFEFARSLPCALGDVRWGEVRAAIATMAREGTRQLRQAGVRRDDVAITLAVDVRHRGQGDPVTVELGDALHRKDPAVQVEEAFEATYVRSYGRRPPGVEPEIMTWRVRVMGPEPQLDVRARRRADTARPALKGRRRVWFLESGRFVSANVYDRYALGPGDVVKGPAVVEERESTAVIGPGSTGRVDEVGTLVVTVR
ncbi:MAG TPA: hydantoinase/oxoprolinase family protein [Actinomycetota bacterium]